MIDTHLIFQSLPALLKGASMSLAIATFSCGIGIFFGSFLGLCYLSSSKWVRFPLAAYVTVFRGTPMLVQIMFVFYVLPQAGINLPGFWCAVVAIGLNSAAYISQTIRTGINAISIGQLEAAKCLGMTSWQTIRHIIIPQVYRITLPSLGNELVTLIKDSSLASIIGVMELSKEGSIIRSQTYDAFTVLLEVSCIYLLMTTCVTFCLKTIEKKKALYV